MIRRMESRMGRGLWDEVVWYGRTRGRWRRSASAIRESFFGQCPWTIACGDSCGCEAAVVGAAARLVVLSSIGTFTGRSISRRSRANDSEGFGRCSFSEKTTGVTGRIWACPWNGRRNGRAGGPAEGHSENDPGSEVEGAADGGAGGGRSRRWRGWIARKGAGHGPTCEKE